MGDNEVIGSGFGLNHIHVVIIMAVIIMVWPILGTIITIMVVIVTILVVNEMVISMI